MERQYFIQQFARRLTHLLEDLGLGSKNSKAKVKIKDLATISGCSSQMARRYVLGEALPDVDVLFKIAQWLKVSPGWLLFGTDNQTPNNFTQKNLIQIEPELLEYILARTLPLLQSIKDIKGIISFTMDIIKDCTYINADHDTILKMVEIHITSATRFQKNYNNEALGNI